MGTTSHSRELVTAHGSNVSGDLELLTPFDCSSFNKGDSRHATISGKNRKKNLKQQHFLPRFGVKVLLIIMT